MLIFLSPISVNSRRSDRSKRPTKRLKDENSDDDEAIKKKSKHLKIPKVKSGDDARSKMLEDRKFRNRASAAASRKRKDEQIEALRNAVTFLEKENEQLLAALRNDNISDVSANCLTSGEASNDHYSPKDVNLPQNAEIGRESTLFACQ
jgi:hypothetical protein